MVALISLVLFCLLILVVCVFGFAIWCFGGLMWLGVFALWFEIWVDGLLGFGLMWYTLLGLAVRLLWVLLVWFGGLVLPVWVGFLVFVVCFGLVCFSLV